MHIIVVSDRQAAPRSFTLGKTHIAAFLLLMLTGLVGLVLGVQALLGRPADSSLSVRGGMAAVSDMGPTLNMMAAKLGEMEAQLLRLDAFSDRMAHMMSGRSGQAARPAVVPANPAAPAATPELHSAAPTLETLREQLALVADKIEQRTVRLNHLESALVDASAAVRTLPTTSPIPDGTHSSNYGARSDPFDGTASFHPGIDFPAPVGTQFLAAATGMVTTAHMVPEYGNMIEIDHGNGLTTRYAHASRLTVHEGEMVVKGQVIGLVGTTGRSTGPHLHFEVRDHGQTLNPEKFLRLQG